MNEFLEVLYSEGKAFSWLELVAVISAIIYVVLASKANRWCFLFGLISSVIYVYITYQLKFYFDFGINLYYIYMSFYGWWAWSKTEKETPQFIKKIKISNLGYLTLIGMFIAVLLASLATRFSEAELPYLDAFTTIFSIIATFLVVKRYIENWLIWVVVDAVAVYMYFYKELYLTSILFFIYTIIAVFGYIKWKRLLISQ